MSDHGFASAYKELLECIVPKDMNRKDVLDYNF